MEEIKEDDIEKIKEKLKSYKEKDIEYNEPHFTYQLMLRGGRKEEIPK